MLVILYLLNENNFTSAVFGTLERCKIKPGDTFRRVRAMARKLRADHIGEHRTAYEKNRQRIFASQNVCGICGQPVDRSFKYPHPMSAVVDHIVPIDKGGHPSDISNLQLAHRWCNRQKSDKLVDMKSKLQNESGSENIAPLPLHFDWKNYKAKII